MSYPRKFYSSVSATTTPPAPILVGGEDRCIIEDIIRHRRRGNKVQFLIRWQGFDASEDTWCNEEELLERAARILREYRRKHEL